MRLTDEPGEQAGPGKARHKGRNGERHRGGKPARKESRPASTEAKGQVGALGAALLKATKKS
jgi:hypothetical protein